MPRSRRVCSNARKRIAPNAQLNIMTTDRGNSAAKTDPEDKRLHRWNCEAISIRIARATLHQSGSDNGPSHRRMTNRQGTENIR